MDFSEKQVKRLDRAHMDLYNEMPELRRDPEQVDRLDDASFEGDWKQYETELEGLSDAELSEEIKRRKRFTDCL